MSYLSSSGLEDCDSSWFHSPKSAALLEDMDWSEHNALNIMLVFAASLTASFAEWWLLFNISWQRHNTQLFP